MDEETKKAVVESLKKNRVLPRKHADFFNWYDKETKELAICSELIHYLIKECGESFNSIILGSDPPDCIAISEKQKVAIEIVELVDQSAIEKQIRSKHAYPCQEPWTSKRLTEHLNKLIQQKDRPQEREYLKNLYPRYITLIHTDEPELMASDFDRLYVKETIQTTDLVNEVYLLFSYDPRIDGYPIRKLV